jgi:soluble lytic murein transglycosylase
LTHTEGFVARVLGRGGPGHHLKRVVTGAAVLVLVLILAPPGELAVSERLDPLSKAERLVSEGRYLHALKLLNTLPDEAMDPWAGRRVRLQRAICLMKADRYEEALSGLRESASAFEPIADYLVYWEAECLAGLGMPDSAAVGYARALTVDPSTALRDRALLESARLDAAAGRYVLAAKRYRKMIGRSSREPEALLGLAAALQSAGDTVQARSVRGQLLRDHPGSSEARSALGRLGAPVTTAELFYAGRAHAAQGNTRRAIKHFRKVLTSSSGKTWQGRAQYELGKAYYARKDYRTAMRAFQRASTEFRVPKALYEMGNCSVKLGSDRKGAEHFLAFSKQYPRVPGAAEAIWNAAMAYERLGRTGQAREAFLLLAARYPKSEFADKGRWRAGFTLYQKGDFDASARAFLDLAAHTEEHYLRDQGYFWAGKALKQAGREEEGVRWTRRAAEGFPASYYSSRAWAMGNEADTRYPDVAKLDSVLPEGDYERSDYLVKGDLLASLGMYREAQGEYLRARWAHQDDLFALGDLLQRLERIGAMNQALQVSNQIATLERDRGIPVALSSFRRLYPTYYWGEISRSAQETGLDPNLILAVIRQESAFDREAESTAGARGLMQVMPATGRIMARKARIRRFRVEDLWEARTSIRLGSQHLSDHYRYFRNQDGKRLSLALSAYNAGLKAARRWSRRLSEEDVDEFVERIPYRETRNYVKLVYRNYQVYSYLQSELQSELTEAGH